MNVAPATTRVGRLASIRVVRHVEPFHPPVGFPPAVLDAVRADLATLGCKCRNSAPDAVEFDGPRLDLVSAGTITFDTVPSGQAMRLELWLNPWFTYGWAIAAMGIGTLHSTPARVLWLLILMLITVLSIPVFVDGYVALAREAVRRGTLALAAGAAGSVVSLAAAGPAVTGLGNPGRTTAPGTVSTGEEMEARLAELTGLGAWEWQLHAFDGDRLTLVGGQDMDYGHFAEAYFAGLSYISCPTRMMHARFRLGSEHEATLARLQAEVPRGSFVIAIDSGTTSSLDATSLVVATSAEMKILRP